MVKGKGAAPGDSGLKTSRHLCHIFHGIHGGHKGYHCGQQGQLNLRFVEKTNNIFQKTLYI